VVAAEEMTPAVAAVAEAEEAEANSNSPRKSDISCSC
jgi:hypothetical protein